jgi:hypothetical protein
MTVLRRNVFVKRLPASAPEAARPSLLVGHFPRSGPGSDDWYAIYGNVFYQNPSEALLQAEGSVAVYANLFVNEHGVRSLPAHNDAASVTSRETPSWGAGYRRGLSLDGATAPPAA